MKFYSRICSNISVALGFIFFLLCPFVVNGSLPLIHRSNGPPHPATPNEVDNLKYYMTLSGNSYCDSVIPHRQWECGNCDRTSNMEIVQVFVTPKYDINAMVVRDDDMKRIISVFRGSKTQKNFDANGDIMLTEYKDQGPLVRVHRGFMKSYEEVAPQILPAVQEQIMKYPGYTVATTGHSLGGALATLHGLDLHELGFDASIYSYASPRMGNIGFAKYSSESGAPYHRITSRRDLYVDCPIQLVNYLGYSHAGEESWIQENDEILVCPNGLETDDCYNSDKGLRDNNNHYDYFDLKNNMDCLYQDTMVMSKAVCSFNQLLELRFLPH
ncbi:Alpha/Beta hydrolase protein [Phascolomyces articulosus]|uniref:Alpha/Beta hydrolase protein n=1 Tax=Phascolomyces articulosus TaxID=60185 RepID=A0AAD5JPA9_9FUNG|nr:Alpha/Beta hydrolase protein [Phascolomyces articulosus]